MIRPATLADAPAIARVHSTSWRETYEGIIPDEVLENFNFGFRHSRWQKILLEPKTEEGNLVVDEGGVVGFVSCGPLRDEEPGYSAELYAIYLLKSHQGRGLGKQLFDAAIDFLKSKGHTSMLLWVLKDNSTTQFYERMGGMVVGQKDIRVTPLMLLGVAYGWPNLKGVAP